MMNSDIDILARTIYGEARGETYKGKKAVAHVIMNRTSLERFKYDMSIAATCLRAWQFSAWLPNDPNVEKMHLITLDTPLFRECYRAALEAMDEADFTNGATHYHTKAIDPNWAQGKVPCWSEGSHLFYNDVD